MGEGGGTGMRETDSRRGREGGTDGWTDGRTDRLDGQRDGWMDGGWMDGGWMDRQMEREIDGEIDGQLGTDRQTCMISGWIGQTQGWIFAMLKSGPRCLMNYPSLVFCHTTCIL